MDKRNENVLEVQITLNKIQNELLKEKSKNLCNGKIKNNQLQCQIYGKSFTVNSRLKRHVLTHTDEKPFSCTTCMKNFRLKEHLKTHLKQHCDINQDKRKILPAYQCKICLQLFYTLKLVREHISENHVNTNDVIPCTVCEENISTKCVVERHQIDTLKPYECTVCNKKFSFLNNLVEHFAKHTGKYLHECKVCQKGFNKKHNFKRHMLIHTGEKPFHCELCSQHFRHATTLKVHIQSHTGEKPFLCQICGKTFADKRSLDKHSEIC